MITGANMPPKIIEKAIHKPLLLPKPTGFSKAKWSKTHTKQSKYSPP